MGQPGCLARVFPVTAKGYRDDFDFSLAFENISFAIVPNGLCLLLTLCRIAYLMRKPKLIPGRICQLSKTVTFTIFIACQGTLSALWSTSGKFRSALSTASASLSTANAIALAMLFYQENLKCYKPSPIILVYFLITMVMDAIRTRTLWLLMPATPGTAVFTVSTLLKIVLILLDSIEKTRDPFIKDYAKRPEERSSILNRSIFLWLQQLLLTGTRGAIEEHDLYELDYTMTGDCLMSSFDHRWNLTGHKSAFALLWTLLWTLKWSIMMTIFPRLVLLALNLCQPILLRSLLNFLESSPNSPARGHILIGAYAVVYIGIAITTGFYWRCHWRVLTMIRGSLVAVIGRKTTRLNLGARNERRSAITLMNSDIETIHLGLLVCHELWANVIQAGVAVYLLERQLGFACFVPVVVALVCAAGSVGTIRILTSRQTTWLKTMQRRIAVTSDMLHSTKSLRMRGLTDQMHLLLTCLRYEEIQIANLFKFLLIWTLGLGFTQQFISPILTFAAFVLKADANDTTFSAPRAFTSFALLLIFVLPASQLIQLCPRVMSVLACFQRIQTFLAAGEQEDCRWFSRAGDTPAATKSSQDNPSGTLLNIELPSLHMDRNERLHPAGEQILHVRDGAFGWQHDRDILRTINFSVKHGTLTCVIGPVACGKSTLCKALLGETSISKGRIEILTRSKEIGFCDQEPYLRNASIQANIIGCSTFKSSWYKDVVETCALNEDITALAAKDQGLVGDDGSNLSGGQKHRVALARALYARPDILILDDCFSSLDAKTRDHIYKRLFANEGLIGRYGITVISTTHTAPLLQYSDLIITLSADGTIVQKGSLDYLREEPGYLKTLLDETSDNGAKTSTSESFHVDDPQTSAVNSSNAQSNAGNAGNAGVYRYYLSAAGLKVTLALAFFGAAYATFASLSTVWLQFWTAATADSTQDSTAYYLGLYAMLRISALAMFIALAYHVLITLVARTGRELFTRLLDAVLNAPFSHITKIDNGSLINRFSQDMLLIDMELPGGLNSLLSTGLITLGQIVLVIVSSPFTSIAFAVMLAILYVVQNFYLRTSRQLRLLDIGLKAPMYSVFSEIARGLPTIRAFGWSTNELNRLMEALDRSQKASYLFAMVQQWFAFAIDIVVSVIVVSVAALAVERRADAGFTGVALTQLLSLSLVINATLLTWTAVQLSMGAVRRIKGFIAETPTECDSGEAYELPDDWPCFGKIEFKNVSAGYGSDQSCFAVQNVTFTIEPSQKVAFCGRSGSGKSTTLLALLRLLEPNSGSISIDDVDLCNLASRKLAPRINVIPQDPSFLEGTIRFNLDPRNEFSQDDIENALRKVSLLDTVTDRGGIRADMQPESFSYGQRQLLCLAAAMLRKCKIVLMDEPTSSVDHHTERLMQQVIRHEFRGSTIIVVTHRLDSILDFDKVGVFEDGTLREFDATEALLSRDSLFRDMVCSSKQEDSRSETCNDAYCVR